MRGHWTDIDPSKYDEPHEVPGLELDTGSFISPFDVPDGVRLRVTPQERCRIELRYLTDQEKIEFTETELPEIHFGLGRLSNRLVLLEVGVSPGFPEWETVESVLTRLTRRKNSVNHFVALTVLRDMWSVLAEQVQDLETG